MAKKVKTVSDKLSKVGDSMTVYLYDNGYMLEVSGRNKDDEWAMAKILCPTLEDVFKLISEADEMERE